MKSIIKPLLLGVFVLAAAIVSDAQEQSQGPCSDFYKEFDSMKFHRIAYGPEQCLMSAAKKTGEMNYRSYLLSTDGTFMVFESYDGGPASTSTGSKVYHFFPRDRQPTVVDHNGRVELFSSNSKVSFKFNQIKGILTEMSGAELVIDHNVEKSLKGGITFKNSQILMLESGYALGADPTSSPRGTSTFVDSAGNRCPIVNKEVFEYFSNGDNEFMYTDAELKTFLKSRCPQINPGF